MAAAADAGGRGARRRLALALLLGGLWLAGHARAAGKDDPAPARAAATAASARIEAGKAAWPNPDLVTATGKEAWPNPDLVTATGKEATGHTLAPDPQSLGKAPDGRSTVGKTISGKAPDGKAPDGKAPDGKAPDGKAGRCSVVHEETTRGACYRPHSGRGMCQPQSIPYVRCRLSHGTCRLGNTSPVGLFHCEARRGATHAIPRAGTLMAIDVHHRHGMPTGHTLYVEEACKEADGTYRLRVSHTNYDRRCHLEEDAIIRYDPRTRLADFATGHWAAWAHGISVQGFIYKDPAEVPTVGAGKAPGSESKPAPSKAQGGAAPAPTEDATAAPTPVKPALGPQWQELPPLSAPAGLAAQAAKPKAKARKGAGTKGAKAKGAKPKTLGPVINYAIHGVIDGRTGKTSLARPSFKAQQAAEPLVTP